VTKFSDRGEILKIFSSNHSGKERVSNPGGEAGKSNWSKGRSLHGSSLGIIAGEEEVHLYRFGLFNTRYLIQSKVRGFERMFF